MRHLIKRCEHVTDDIEVWQLASGSSFDLWCVWFVAVLMILIRQNRRLSLVASWPSSLITQLYSSTSSVQGSSLQKLFIIFLF